nr:hypothetical protein [Pseudomonas caspiana]
MDRSTLPMLVLLPGMDGTGELFQPFVSALKHRCDTVVVTYPSDIPLSYEDLQAIARQALPTVQPPGFSGQPTADRHRAHPLAQSVVARPVCHHPIARSP